MKRAAFVIILSAFAFTVTHSQKNTWPKSLLWKITGKGLTRPSYIYGTMHLQDKRLFHFSDSLYKFLEEAEGYAMEINLQEYMDSIFQRAIRDKEEEALSSRQSREWKSTKESKKLIDSLVRNVNIYGDKSSKKSLEKIRNKRMNAVIKRKEMSTIMDAYLYSVARRHGKWLGGIEDVQDQLSLSDELGTSLSSEEFLVPDEKLRTSLEEMIKIYLDADLDLLERHALRGISQEAENLIFIRRNVKMALRMDSLSRVRSMFYTVGAAHLPGDSGVIKLLRAKGYQVEPVFSSKKVAPELYAAKLKDVPWVHIQDESKSYSIQMPDKPSDVDMFEGFVKMKVSTDLTNMTFYMIGSASMTNKMDVETAAKNFKSRANGEIGTIRKVMNDGIEGREMTMKSEGAFFRIQMLIKDYSLYLLMAGSENAGQVQQPDIDKYFSSFKGYPSTIATSEPMIWRSFSLPDKGFRISFPGEPRRNRIIERKAEGTVWKFAAYEYNHKPTNTYFMIQVRDLRAGYHLLGDSAYFSLFRENIAEQFEEILEEKQYVRADGFPAYQFDGVMKESGLVTKTLNINRGNRIYTILTLTDNKDSLASVEKFVNSIELIPYRNGEWRSQSGNDGQFFTMAPAPIEKKMVIEIDTAVKAVDEIRTDAPVTPDEETDERFVSYDSIRSVSYEINRSVFGRYTWFESDSMLSAVMSKVLVEDGDSLISKKTVSNGSWEGMELIFEERNNNSFKKLRHFINGDTLYSIYAYIPRQHINDATSRYFFEEFGIRGVQNKVQLLESRAALLLEDAKSADSATRARAVNALYNAPFGVKDLPLLHARLLQPLSPDSADDNSARMALVRAIKEIADPSTIEFIRNNYYTIPANKEIFRLILVDMLTEISTRPSYDLLKELLMKQPPADRKDRYLPYGITDSVELAAQLFPEILSLATNPVWGEWVFDISNRLIKENAITLQTVETKKEALYHMADTLHRHLEKKAVDEYSGYSYHDLLELLEKLNDPASKGLLQKFSLLKEMSMKHLATISLLRLHQNVPAVTIQQLAADPAYRRALYDSLSAFKRLALFPAKYATQRWLAESDVWEMAESEDPPTRVVFLQEKVATFRGKKQKFMLFRVEFEYEGEDGKMETERYLGVGGPYSLDSKNVTSKWEATAIDWEGEIDSKKIDEQFRKLLAKYEEEN